MPSIHSAGALQANAAKDNISYVSQFAGLWTIAAAAASKLQEGNGSIQMIAGKTGQIMTATSSTAVSSSKALWLRPKAIFTINAKLTHSVSAAVPGGCHCICLAHCK